MSIALVRVQSGLLSAAKDSAPDVAVFRGVPYAAPPVGERRWRAPAPPLSWQGVREAEAFGAAAVQQPYAEGSFYRREFFREPVSTSEDCLFLNVWTPAQSASDGLPVYVWVHGGGLYQGWSHSRPFDGGNLAKLGMVVVTINYRLNIFGLLAHPELSAESPWGGSGNYALLDQIAAFTWVRDNIAGFGGDPARVTIGGQSGGGRCMGVHMVSPLTKGLFARVIAESGSAVGGGVDLTLAQAERDGLTLMKRMGARSLKELRVMPAGALLNRFLAAAPKWPAVTPVIDGHTYGEDPARVFQKGGQHKIPLLSGSTTSEGVFNCDGMTAESYRRDASRYGGLTAEYLSRYPGDSLEEALRSANAYYSDRYYACHRAMSLLHSETSGQRAYQYLFDKAPPGRDSGLYGAFHTAELAYVFENLAMIGRPWQEADRRLSQTMSAYWANFIKTGDPNGEGCAPWKPSTAANDSLMLFRDTAAMAPAPCPEQKAFVEARLREWLDAKGDAGKLVM